jgi:hypothetical protein
LNTATLLLTGALSALVVTSDAAQKALPRTADGHPDLQGIWANDTVTTLERPKRFADKEVLSEQEAIAYEHDRVGRWSDRFGELEVTTTGELSDEWQENGTVVPGRRTSLIVDPTDGKIPALTPRARARADARADAMKDHPADGPEDRTLYERCLTGSAGPPMLPPVYNQNLQIVQTRDHVLILTEMIHDARIVRMNAGHLPSPIRLWLGDSVGRWDADTLVVDTTNFTDKTRFRGSGDGLHVIERFTRTSAVTIRYDFTVDDASSFTRPWSGRLWIRRTKGPIYEYGCHEGNYSMVGVLRGARFAEAESLKQQ